MPMTRNLLRAVMLMTAGFSACSPSADKRSDDYYVRIVSPEQKAVLSGLADIKVAISIPEEPASYEVGFDGETLTQFNNVSGNLRLNTTALENGEKTLKVVVTGASGAKWSDTREVQINNATHQLISYQLNADAYAKGEEIVLKLTYPVPSLRLGGDFSKLDDQFVATDVTAKDLGSGQYELHYTLSANDAVAAGRYEALITATNANDETVATPIDIMLRSGPRLPIKVTGGTYVDDASVPFSTDASVAPTIQAVASAGAVISGSPNNLSVTWAAPASTRPADRIIIRSADYAGYYVVPVAGATNQQATIPVELAEAPSSTNTISHDFLKLLLATVDTTGTTGGWTAVTLSKYHTTTTGTLITLWWDNPVTWI